MRTSVIALCSLLLIAAGCGEAGSSAEDFDGQQRAVAEVIEDLQEASVDDEPRVICEDLLARSLLRTVGNGCARAVDQALKDADTYELDVKDVRITGTTARARVEAGREGDQVETIDLVREGRAWKISRLAGPAR